jgi:hypothetical protein
MRDFTETKLFRSGVRWIGRLGDQLHRGPGQRVCDRSLASGSVDLSPVLSGPKAVLDYEIGSVPH